MSRPEAGGVSLHLDPVLFREAVSFTAAQTALAPNLIEKDYFCTLLLERLAAAEGMLVFKGGTCLAKVHAGFYRLSEDLDFAIRRLGLQQDEELIGLVRRKLVVPGNEPVDLSGERREILQRQIESELKPILRPADFAEFDLDRSFEAVSAMAIRIT